VLIFAFNTAETDYVGIADRAAALAQKNLQLPVTLITDTDSQPKFAYDKIVRITQEDSKNVRQTVETNQTVTWRNLGRYQAYNLSPYDQTILIDSDYFVLDSSLATLFDKSEYQIMYNNYGLNGHINNIMGPMSLQYVWATVIVFDRSNLSEALFDLAGKIQRNYGYYCSLFNVPATNYRNDYAFAMAHYIVSNDPGHFIPYSMFTVDTAIDSIELAERITIKTPNTAHIVPVQNLHIMSKQFLTSNKFDRFYQAAINV
jgi:hypothetical protein